MTCKIQQKIRKKTIKKLPRADVKINSYDLVNTCLRTFWSPCISSHMHNAFKLSLLPRVEYNHLINQYIKSSIQFLSYDEFKAIKFIQQTAYRLVG